jgi:superfamily II RNA helicase
MNGLKEWLVFCLYHNGTRTERGCQPFDQLTALTDAAEGTIVRVITRLDETCREVRDAARVIGDAVLMKKMEEAQMKIKRDSK